LPTVYSRRPVQWWWMYQHDNAPCHKSRSVRECSGYICAGRMGCHSARVVQTPGRKSPQQSSSCHKAKGGPTTGKYVTGKVRLQFRGGVRILLIR
jgi:hypothetical protein